MSALGPICRLILFTKDVAKLRAFYTESLGMEVLPGEDDGWVELSSGGCILALHKAHGKSSGAGSPVKIVFGSDDVPATREKLVQLGLKMGKIQEWNGLQFCDGADPDGNPFQISNRGYGN